MREQADRERDLEKIERLHRRDMEASRTGDFDGLRSLISDDAVMLPPGGKPARGCEEIEQGMSRMAEAMSGVEVLEYELDFEEVEVVGDYAFEWGYIRGAMRAKGGGKIERSTYKVMRILQKQPDGSWKVHRSIWNDAPKGEDG